MLVPKMVVKGQWWREAHRSGKVAGNQNHHKMPQLAGWPKPTGRLIRRQNLAHQRMPSAEPYRLSTWRQQLRRNGEPTTAHELRLLLVAETNQIRCPERNLCLKHLSCLVMDRAKPNHHPPMVRETPVQHNYRKKPGLPSKTHTYPAPPPRGHVRVDLLTRSGYNLKETMASQHHPRSPIPMFRVAFNSLTTNQWVDQASAFHPSLHE